MLTHACNSLFKPNDICVHSNWVKSLLVQMSVTIRSSVLSKCDVVLTGIHKLYIKIHIHYSDVIMGTMPSQITSFKIVYSAVYSGRSKKTSKPHVTGLCAGNSPVTGEFPAQMASNADNISIWLRHHEKHLTKWYHFKPSKENPSQTWKNADYSQPVAMYFWWLWWWFIKIPFIINCLYTFLLITHYSKSRKKSLYFRFSQRETIFWSSTLLVEQG